MAPPGKQSLNLTRLIQMRISPRADKALKARAEKIGIKPSTLARTILYKSLGVR